MAWLRSGPSANSRDGARPHTAGARGKLALCRSVQDLVALESSLIRESLRYMVEDADSIVGISLRAVDEARRALAGTAQESAAQGRRAEPVRPHGRPWRRSGPGR